MSTDDNDPTDLVFGDVGGWISGPSLDVGQLGGLRFGLNIGAWMKTYPCYVLQGGFDGFGFVCWRRSTTGRPSGEPMPAATLRDLAVLDHAGEGRRRLTPRRAARSGP